MKIIVSAESSIDLPQALLDEYRIKTTPFKIAFKDELVEDADGVSKDVFEFVEKTKVLPKTSAVSPEQFREHFEKLKKDYDAIIHISLGSNFSCAYNNARLVSEDMDNVFVVDSKSLSTGIALLAIYARNLIEKGLTPKEIAKLVEEKTSKVRASFMIEKLNFLHKGGRCSALTLLGANLLKIKPQIVVLNGKMGVGRKYRGALNKCVENYVEDLLSEYNDVELENVFITHSTDMPEIEEMVERKLKDKGFKNIYNTYAGGAISCHCGPNCLGVLFVEK